MSGVPYHAWTHRPKAQGGTDPIAVPGSWGVPDLILSGGATTVPDNTIFNVPWQNYSTPHTSAGPTAPFNIADPDGTLFSLAITDDGDTGNDRYQVTSYREGWWASELITQWDSVTTPGTEDIAGVQQRITWTNLTGFSFSPNEYMDTYDWMIVGGAGGAINSFGFQDNSYIRTWIAPHYVPYNRTWQAFVRQRTGDDRGMSGIKWAWWFIEADNLDAWTFGYVYD